MESKSNRNQVPAHHVSCAGATVTMCPAGCMNQKFGGDDRGVAHSETVMRALSAAIVILAGATLFAGGTIGHSILASVKPENRSLAPEYALVGGAIVGLIGLVLLATVWSSDATPPAR